MPPPIPAFTTLAELSKRITRRRVVELFDDDGDGDLAGDDLTAVEDAIAATSDAVTSILFKKGFELEQLDQLAADLSIRRYATDICLQYGGERKTEFLDAEGKGTYNTIGDRARKDLQAFTTGELRSRVEETAGTNPIVSGDVSTGDPVFIVSRNPNQPGSRGPGGF